MLSLGALRGGKESLFLTVVGAPNAFADRSRTIAAIIRVEGDTFFIDMYYTTYPKAKQT